MPCPPTLPIPFAIGSRVIRANAPLLGSLIVTGAFYWPIYGRWLIEARWLGATFDLGYDASDLRAVGPDWIEPPLVAPNLGTSDAGMIELKRTKTADDYRLWLAQVDAEIVWIKRCLLPIDPDLFAETLRNTEFARRNIVAALDAGLPGMRAAA